MARTGVTQKAVNAAADRLLQAGERPTIERVRAALGTGSPNTLIRLLDAWWAELGQRLQTHAAKLALPNAPAPVAALASTLWEKALEAAHVHATQDYAEAREQLTLECAALEVDRQALSQQAEDFTTQLSAARQAEALAQIRLTDALRLVEQQAKQLGDLGLQRDLVTQRIERLERELADAHARLRDQEMVASAERERHINYIEALESRVGVEIDRARQEARAARQDLATVRKEHARQLDVAHMQRNEAISALASTQNDVAAQRARADALERQQGQLADLAATVQDALNRTRSERPAPPKKALSRAPKARSPKVRRPPAGR